MWPIDWLVERRRRKVVGFLAGGLEAGDELVAVLPMSQTANPILSPGAEFFGIAVSERQVTIVEYPGSIDETPSSAVASLPRDAVGARWAKGVLSAELCLVLPDGEELSFQVPRIHRRDGKAVFDALS